MPRLPKGKLEGFRPVPWDDQTSQELKNLGYKTTNGLVVTQGHVQTWEMVKDGQVFWSRVFHLSLAPPNYIEQMFPEDLKPPELVQSNFVAPVLGVHLINGWLFTFIDAHEETLAQISRRLTAKFEAGAEIDLEVTFKNYFHQIIGGLTNLHALGYIHGDLCPENCLLVGNRIRIAGYSLVKGHDSQRPMHIGMNYKYRPLPSNDGSTNLAAADVWALGVMMFELMTGEQIVQGAMDASSHVFQLRMFLNFNVLRSRVVDHQNLSQEAKDLIAPCLDPKDSQRPQVGLISNYEFFKNLDPRNVSSASSVASEEIEIPADEMTTLREHQIEVKSQIGSGFFGKVFKVKFCGQKLAMKQMRFGRSSRGAGIVGQAGNLEVEVMKTLKHKHLIQAIYTVEVPFQVTYILMELAVSDLLDQVKALAPERNPNAARMIEERMVHWLYQVALGVAFMHDNGYAHCDLKAQNCLIRGNDEAVVADFGLVVRVNDTNDEKIIEDIELYEQTIEECLFGENVFLRSENIRKQGISDEAKDLLLSIRDKPRPAKPKMNEVLAHPWFANERTIQGAPESMGTWISPIAAESRSRSSSFQNVVQQRAISVALEGPPDPGADLNMDDIDWNDLMKDVYGA